MIAGIVLSAGRSRRMGQPKALLMLNGETFLDSAIGALGRGGCDPLVVVHGGPDQPGNPEIIDIATRHRARAVANPDADSEQLVSIRMALEILPDNLDGAVITPVDAPGASAEVVRAMIAAADAGAVVSVAAWKGRRGHPILFAGAALAALRSDDLEQGARSVLRRYADETVEVEGRSAAVLHDIDTPEQYRSITEVGE